MEAIAHCGLAAGLAWVFTRWAVSFARRVGFLDWPDKTRKLHPHATPLLGGVAVFAALVVTLALGQCAGWNDLLATAASLRLVVPLLASAAILCAVGVWDDKYGMNARDKFLWQIAAVLPYALLGRSLGTAEVFGWQVHMAWLGIPLTVFWLVACTNFVNLVDGLDGLASTVTLIVSATIGILSIVNCQPDVPIVALTLAGALIGFLWHNWPPARIFLGDSGSLPLGFLAGALALEASAKKAAGVTLVMPLVLLSVPMFDTTMAILRRKLTGRRIGEGDRAHIHHCLRDRGLTPQQTLLTIGGLCLATSTAVVVAAVFNNDTIAVVACAAILGALIAGRVFGFREAELLGRHVSATWTLFQPLRVGLKSRFVLARFGTAAEQRWPEFWEQLVREMKRRDGRSLEVACREPRDDSGHVSLSWISKHPAAEEPVWELTCRIPRGAQGDVVVRATGIVHARRSPALQELLDLLAAFGQIAPFETAPAVLRLPEKQSPQKEAA